MNRQFDFFFDMIIICIINIIIFNMINKIINKFLKNIINIKKIYFFYYKFLQHFL